MSWEPLHVVAYTVILEVVPTVLLLRRGVPIARLVAATLITAVAEFGVVFAVSGFGWGWPNPSGVFLVVLRMLMGSSIGLCVSLFAFIISQRLKMTLGIILTVINAIAFLGDPNSWLLLQLIFSFLASSALLIVWLRSVASHNRLPPDRSLN